ncbi:MAG TPA: extracellular solute-binding protein [Candidatus Acidoferrales bacterium]|nr:extracellular solute-binding protein [Candidatus Acidoferrales bacterium]
MNALRLHAPVISAILLLALFSPDDAAGASDPKVIEAAKSEREVVWYTTTNLEPAKRIVDLFRAKYPFLHVNLFRTNVAPLTSRVLLEARAGKFEWDVLSGGGEFYPPVKERGLIAPYRSPEARMVEDDMVDKDGYWTAYTASTFVLGFNTKMVRKEEVPKTCEALINPRWKGQKIGVDTTAGMFHSLMSVWGREKTIAYFKQLAALDPAPKDSTSLMAQLLGAGEFPLAFGTAHIFELLGRKGGPVDWIPLEPAVVRVVPTTIGAKARHPNAAKLLYDFLIGEEGQRVMKDFNRIPVRKDVAPDPPRLLRGYKRVIMYPDLYKNLDESQKIYDEILKLR